MSTDRLSGIAMLHVHKDISLYAYLGQAAYQHSVIAVTKNKTFFVMSPLMALYREEAGASSFCFIIK